MNLVLAVKAGLTTIGANTLPGSTAMKNCWLKNRQSYPPGVLNTVHTSSKPMETGRTFKLNGNVINGGMITNLPADCCAEGPIFVDRTGLHKTVVGDLPPQLAALNLTNINVQRLTVQAAITGDVEHIVHACAMDPLTSAVLTLKEIREMASEMLEAGRQWMPQFAGKTIRPTPTISIPNRRKTRSRTRRPGTGDFGQIR